MKNVLPTMYVLLLLVISGSVQAQNDDPFLKLLAQPKPQADTILLRWVVSDAATWEKGNEMGYTLNRFTTHINGIASSGTTIRNSVVTLEHRLYPLTATAWDSQFPNNDFAKVAKGTLYEADTSTTLTEGKVPTLADAVNGTNSDEARFMFALFAAEQDFAVAKGMALGYCDATVKAGETYIYRLNINGTDMATAISIGADDAPDLPAVDSLIAEGLDKAVAIEWDVASTEGFYSSYTVERSTDGVNFSPLSQLPFIFAADSETAPTNTVYKDSIAQNDMPYYYRVCGRTPFGTKGPPSPVVQAQGIPPRISPFFISINDYQASDNEVTLDWSGFGDSLTHRLAGFNVYRAEDSNSAYEQVNTDPIAPTVRTFTDADPLPVAYYVLEAVDDNNHGYQSPIALVQLPDSIPPAIPIGLVGTFVSDERVQLTWEANTEADFRGYRLFAANGIASNYVQITTDAVATEQFVYEIAPSFIADSIYFKILSCDTRDNHSEKSAPIGLRRPDIIPPSAPILQKVNPTPKGIELGWKFSSSTDVAYHLIERKPVNEPGWVTVLRVGKSNENQFSENLSRQSLVTTCFIDTAPLNRQAYEYRLRAYDLDENMSSSEVIAVRPFDNGERGIIENFQAKAACLPVGAIDNEAGYATLENILSAYEYGGVINTDSLLKLAMWQIINGEEYEQLQKLDAYEVKVFLEQRKLEVWEGSIIAQVNLAWAYAEEDYLQDFQIYRSSEGSPIMLYKTLPLESITSYAFLDEDVEPNRRYYYQIVARHADGGFSKKSKTIMVKVPKF